MSSAARKLFPLVDSEAPAVPAHPAAREVPPVSWSEEAQGWIVRRHEDVLNGLRDARLVASREALLESRLRGVRPELAEALRATLAAHPWDGREAVALRWQAASAFTPSVLGSWRPAIRDTVRWLVRHGGAGGRLDAVRAVCEPLPALVLADVFDLPGRHREPFLLWARRLAAFQGSVAAGPVQPEALAREALDATHALLDVLVPLLEERRRAPGGDLLSRMLQVEQAGPRSTVRRVTTLALRLVSELGAATDQLGNGLHELLSHPEQARQLQADRSRMRATVEEVLRLRPAQPWMPRIVGETLSLRGCTLSRGDTVFLDVAAANRDPHAFQEPDRFDLDRREARHGHLTFGFGLHQRLDAGLVRHELEALLEVLLEELPGLRLDEERPPRVRDAGALVWGLEALPVRG